VHLAAAIDLTHAGGEVSFGCFDDRLRRAARREKLSVASFAS
jgi:hypothetical protein